MAFIFAYSPFKALTSSPSSDDDASTPIAGPSGSSHNLAEVSASSSSSSSSSSRTTQTSGRTRNGRRQLTRQGPHDKLLSPWTTPRKPEMGTSNSSSTSSMLSNDSQLDIMSKGKGREFLQVDNDSNLTLADSGYESEPEDSIVQTTKIDFLGQLPLELALAIILQLDSHQELLAVGLVSKHWRTLAIDSYVWREYFRRNRDVGWALRPNDAVEVYLRSMHGELLLEPTVAPGSPGTSSDSPLAVSTPSKTAACGSLKRQVELSSPFSRHIPGPSSTPSGAIARTSPAQDGWWSNASQTERFPLVEQLDWRKVYAARYRLGQRWGEVGSGRGRTPRSAPRSKESLRDERINEDWDDSDDDIVAPPGGPWPQDSGNTVAAEGPSRSEDEDGGSNQSFQQAEDKDDEEAAALREAEAHSYISASTLAGSLRSSSSHQRDLNPSLRLVGSHTDYIYCVRAFPSYKHMPPSQGFFVTGSRDSTIRVWDTATGESLHTLKGHDGSVLSIDICARGEILVSGSSDRSLGIWSWFGSAEAIAAHQAGKPWTPRLLDRWNCHASVMDVRVTEKYMVIGLRSGSIRCYRRNDPAQRAAHPERRMFEKVSSYQGHNCAVNDIKVQGDRLVAGYSGGALELIDLTKGTLIQRFNHQKGIACVEFEGDIVIAGASDHVLRCYQASTGRLLLVLRGHEELPRSIHLNLRGGILISVGYDGIINLWDITLLWPCSAESSSALGSSWNALCLRHAKARSFCERMEASRDEAMDRAWVRARRRSGDRIVDNDDDDVEEAYLTTTELVDRVQEAGEGQVEGGPCPEKYQRAHPMADPIRPYKPRYSIRTTSGGPPVVHQQAAQQGPVAVVGTEGVAAAGAAEEGPQPHHQAGVRMRRPEDSNCRLFDVDFDGKRIFTVGEGTNVSIREVLREEDGERYWLGWEIFA